MGMDSSIKKAVNRDMPTVATDATVRDAVMKMVSNNATAVIVKVSGAIAGVVTEMDLLHSIDRGDDPDATPISKVMTPCDLITAKGARNPCVQLDCDQSVKNALAVMQQAGIHHLIITDESDDVYGVVSLIDVLKTALT